MKSKIKKKIWAVILGILNFNWRLRSKLEIRIRNYGDWTIYNEIFVNEEYDVAIMDFIRNYQPDDKQINILDLGANVGFFSVRFCDLAFQNGVQPENIHLTLVEADHRCLKYLEHHCSQLISLGTSVKICHGLAGKLSGEEFVQHGRETFGTSVVKDTKRHFCFSRSSFLKYLDLTPLLPKKGSFDLIKCDIEGSEYDFIKTYPQIIGSADFLLMEFHPKKGSLSEAEIAITQYGLNSQTTLAKEDDFVTKYYKKVKNN